MAVSEETKTEETAAETFRPWEEPAFKEATLKEKLSEEKLREAMNEATTRIKQLWPQDEDMKRRVYSAMVMAPAALLVIWIGGFLLYLAVVAAAVIMAFEWYGMIENTPGDDEKRRRWMLIGSSYITVGCASFLWLYALPSVPDKPSGALVIFWLLMVVWATDIFALLVGRQYGGAKLMPSISPNKTRSGLIGGVLGGAVISSFFALVPVMPGFFTLFVWGTLTALIAQGGDLLESYFKRRFGVKDSGALIPGHGGLLDRVDGLMIAAPVIMIVLMLRG